MGDFQLRTPSLRYNSPSSTFNLGVGSLELDPELATEIRALRNAPPSPRLRTLISRPNWNNYHNSNPIQFPAVPPRPQPLVPRGGGSTPLRQADLSMLLSAIWAIPNIQLMATRVLDDAAGRARSDWNRLNLDGKALIVSYTTVIAGSALIVGLRTPDPHDTLLLYLILDRNIPVPGVDGLEFKISARGGQVSFNNIVASGISARVAGGQNNIGQFQGEIQITLNLAQWLPAFR